MSNPTKDQLLEQAKELGIEVPADATKADIEALLPAPEPAEGKRKEERRKIETVSERGDWLDPFSGLTVAAGNEVNPTNGARREGDEAVLYV